MTAPVRIALVEYARSVLGWADAEHAETAPDAARPAITPLACALAGVRGTVRLLPGTRIAPEGVAPPIVVAFVRAAAAAARTAVPASAG